jgi:hypothetical protein
MCVALADVRFTPNRDSERRNSAFKEQFSGVLGTKAE